MALNTKTREWSKSTAASGEYFDDEFDSLYENDEELDENKFDKAGGTISGNVTIQGDLIIEGDSTIVESTNTEIKDNVITLNKGETGEGVTANGGQSGFEIDRGESYDKAILLWNENIQEFFAGLGDDIHRLLTTKSEPIGTLKFVCNAYFSDDANSDPTIFDIDVPWGYVELDGSAPNDSESSIFNTEDRHVANITDERFFMGVTAENVGITGGSNTSDHTHETDSKLSTISITLAHSHTVDSHDHTLDSESQAHITAMIGSSSGTAAAFVMCFSRDGTDSDFTHMAGITGGTFTPTYITYTTSTGLTNSPSNPEAYSTLVFGSTANSSPGSDSQLTDFSQDLTHLHETISQSDNENRPNFLGCRVFQKIK